MIGGIIAGFFGVFCLWFIKVLIELVRNVEQGVENPVWYAVFPNEIKCYEQCQFCPHPNDIHIFNSFNNSDPVSVDTTKNKRQHSDATAAVI